MGHIFISYSRKDEEYVNKLVEALENEGFEVWIDRELLTGDTWTQVINHKIDTCDAFVIVMTDSSKESTWVTREVLYALQEGKKILPLLLQGKLWMLLQDRNIFQVTDGSVPDKKFFRDIEKTVPRSEAWLAAQRETAEKAAHEKARLKAEEVERLRLIQAQAERMSAEKAEQKRKEKELREKRAREEKEGGQKSVPIKPQIGMQSVYWFGGFAVIVLGIVLFSSLNNPSQSVEPTPVDTPSQITATTIPTKSLGLVATLTPYSTETPAPTSTFTLTPLPVKIIDIKNVPMALVSSGTFIMGSEAGNNDVKNVHEVYLDDFYIDIYEVTNTFYEECVDIGVCSEPVYWDYYREKFYADHPVVYVTWTQADVYCKWREASLPTEAQWEKAARGVDGRTYPWGEDIDCSKASFRSCNKTDTDEVGSYEGGKSPYGMYDMAGNVWEWTADWYEENYYQYSLLSNPSGPESGVYRVMRGGAWSYQVEYLRTYNRRSGNVDGARNVIGFRCAKDAP